MEDFDSSVFEDKLGNSAQRFIIKNGCHFAAFEEMDFCIERMDYGMKISSEARENF